MVPQHTSSGAPPSHADSNIALLRHTIATLAYRGGKTLHGAPVGFGQFRVGEKTRTPAEILAHIGDLLDWALCLANGTHEWHDSIPLPWDEEVMRFFAALKNLDKRLESRISPTSESLFQGPIADALTHVGQLAMLRRLAGSPVRGENYFKADIVAGRLGPQQAGARKDFE